MAKRKRDNRPPFLDIAMCCYGEWDMAAKALAAIPEALGDLSERVQVTLVDNATPSFEKPITNEKGEREAKRVIEPAEMSAPARALLKKTGGRWYRLKENRGYPGGYNFAISKGFAPLVLVLTPDVTMFPGSIERMVRAMDDPKVGMLGPMLTFPEDVSPHGDPGTVQHAGLEISISGKLYHIFLGWPPDHPKVLEKMPVPAVTGACFMTRRRLFRQIGGFNPEYGAGTYEDMEYSFQVQSRGLMTLYLPEARASHFVGGSIRHGAGRGGFNIALNEIYFRGRWAKSLQWTEWRRY